MNNVNETEIRGPYGLFCANKGLSISLIILLILDASATLFSSGFLRYMVLDQNEHLPPQLTISSQLELLISYGRYMQLFLAVLIVVLFCLWVNRTNKNGWMLDAPRMRTTPTAAIAAFFVPIAFFWKPYLVMKEIRSASYARDDSLRKTLSAWWICTMGSFLFLGIAALLYSGEGIETYLRGCKVELVSTPLAMLRNYCGIALIAAITRTQKRRSTFWLK